MNTQISLKYSGPAVDAGTMDVYSAAANMVAFSDFVVAATRVSLGPNTTVEAKVVGVAKGSFITDIAFSVAASVAPLFIDGTIQSVLSTVKESIELWKHLKGEPPKALGHGDSEKISVTNRDGNILVFSNSTVNLVLDDKGVQAAERFIKDALDKEGIDSLTIKTATETLGTITQHEAHYFHDVKPETPLASHQNKMVLSIEAPVFKDGNKWRFSDGSASFWADIEDEGFLARVDQGEAFAKGDFLIVEMRIVQKQVGSKIQADRIIVKVLDHKSPAKTGHLF